MGSSSPSGSRRSRGSCRERSSAVTFRSFDTSRATKGSTSSERLYTESPSRTGTPGDPNYVTTSDTRDYTDEASLVYATVCPLITIRRPSEENTAQFNSPIYDLLQEDPQYRTWTIPREDDIYVDVSWQPLTGHALAEADMGPDPDQSRPESPTLTRFEKTPLESHDLVAMGEGRSKSPHKNVERLCRIRRALRKVSAGVGGSRSNSLH